MTLTVVELNDRAIKVGNDAGIIARSPGFALADGKIVHLGTEAEQQARLKPTQSYNKYWSELSMEPLTHGNNFRHHADIAHAHLQHLAEIGGIDGEVIFAVPGNFSRQQLAILLGLVQHSPMQTVGVVDAAVAAAMQSEPAMTTLVADIQLHQVVLSKLSMASDQLTTDSVIQVPGVGSQHFMNLMMQLATGLFIQQCRFNPQHNAESEQQLYNALPAWLAQHEQDGNLILELQSGSTTHTAKMPRESLVANLNGYYKKILEQLLALAGSANTRLVLSAEMAELPGFLATLEAFADKHVLGADAVIVGSLMHQQHIVAGDSGLHLVQSLPLATGASAKTILSEVEKPTHVLYRHRAIPLRDLEIRNKNGANGHAGLANTLELNINGLPEVLGRIESRDDGVYLTSDISGVIVNQSKAAAEQRLSLGDRIQFSNKSDSISLIRVADE